MVITTASKLISVVTTLLLAAINDNQTNAATITRVLHVLLALVLNVLNLCACSLELRVSNTCSSDVYFSREQIVGQLPSSSSWHVTLSRVKLLPAVAEWLRRLTRNQLGSARTGSNPVCCVRFFTSKLSLHFCLEQQQTGD
ncbi:hypothetical protein T05_7127 [Trichinella murrelli]|uniref:Uncharacterized protein n=1 Tax=Trichinella murrelli TaxID=144512 RepID=A0A0V0UJB6_9BILA|nr:hypothetical protein T05_7127 [Trichinella murrelli]